MKKLFLAITYGLLLASFSSYASADTQSPFVEVSCQEFLNHGAKQGDQCFIRKGKIYLTGSHSKLTNIEDYYNNTDKRGIPYVMFARDKQ